MKQVVITFLFFVLWVSCRKEVLAKEPCKSGEDSAGANVIYDNRQYPWQVTTFSNFKEAYTRYNKQGC